ncbi:MAG: protein kinase domain-containing protein [Myxococcota bacterium]
MSGAGPHSAAGARIGSVVGGKYRLLRLIGEGGMGEVYEAQHLVVGRRFAVKFLHRHLAEHSDALLRFRREAQAAGALENEHIASVVDFDTADDGAPFLVMEFLVGESVAQLLQREGPLPVPRALGIVLQACRGLEAAHDAGIIHRDLKPDNLFSLRRADGSELIKILDFGIAKLTHEDGSPHLTHSGAMMGTPFYMAPEQARGEKLLDQRVDIYALGVILYELLCGRKPHPGDSHNSILAHILTEKVEPLETLRAGLPKGLTSVIERTLSNSRDARPSSVSGLSRELAAFAGREVLPVQSHFDLRPDIASAKTLPTPNTHAVSLPNPAPSESRKAPRRARLVIPAIAIPLVAGASLFAWSQRRDVVPPPTNPPLQSTPSLSASPPAIPAASASATPAPPLNSSASAVPAPVLSPSALPSATASTMGRPLGRPAPVTRTSRGANKTEAATVPKTGKPAESSPKPLNQPGAPRLTFDSNNPYQ